MGDFQADESQLLEPFVLPLRIERFRKVAACRTAALTVVLDHLHHEHNISAVIRSADAFGLKSVHLVGEPVQIHQTISIGSERWIEIQQHEDAPTAVEVLRSAGYRLVVLQTADKPTDRPAMPVYDLPFHEHLALVFGNEKDGLTPHFLEAADLVGHIPMFGFAESLNVSVACAISLFCSTLAGARAERRVPTIGAEEQAKLVGKWLRRDVRAAELIIERSQRDGRGVQSTALES